MDSDIPLSELPDYDFFEHGSIALLGSYSDGRSAVIERLIQQARETNARVIVFDQLAELDGDGRIGTADIMAPDQRQQETLRFAKSFIRGVVFPRYRLVRKRKVDRYIDLPDRVREERIILVVNDLTSVIRSDSRAANELVEALYALTYEGSAIRSGITLVTDLPRPDEERWSHEELDELSRFSVFMDGIVDLDRGRAVCTSGYAETPVPFAKL